MTTLNLQVGAGADDGYIVPNIPYWDNTTTSQLVGAYTSGPLHNWSRYTGVSGLSGATIDSAVYELYGRANSEGSPLTKVYAEDAAAPTAPTSVADYQSRATTTPATDWDGTLTNGQWNNSPSIVSVIQNLADNYDPSVIQILHKDDGSSSASNNWQRGESYDGSTSLAPKLDIDYSDPFVTGAAAISGEGSLAAIGSLILPASAAISGIGTLVAVGTIGTIQLGVVAFSGAGSLSAVAATTLIGKASLDGVGTLTAVGERVVPGAAALDGVGTMAVIGEIGIEGRADFSGVGSMAVVAERIVTGEAAFTSEGTLVPAAVVTVVGAAALTGAATMAVIGETGAILFTIFGEVTREIDPADYPTGTQFFFEAVLAAPDGGSARARLFNVTDAAEVSDSEVATGSVDAIRLRSAALTLPSGAKTYRIEYGGATGDIYTVFAAALLMESA